MLEDYTKKDIEGKIDLLIDNLVHLSDPTGEFSIKVADGSIIDNKSFNYWEWTSGIGLYGMMKYYRITRKQEVLDRIIKWFDDRFEEAPVEKNINTMVQMLTLAYLYEETGNKKYLPYLESWGKWLYYDLPRTERGGFQHVTFGDLNEDEMWDDTLMMSVLTLAKLGKLFHNDDYVEEAKKQFLLHIQFLQDKKTGLWYHGWSFKRRDNFAGAFWGRGNSWVTIVIPEFIELLNLKKNDAIRQFLITSFQYQLDALKKYQTKDGMWTTLIDDSTSYVEGSATAGFAYGSLKAVHNRYVSEDYREMADKGVNAVLDNIDETGSLAHVSAGTPMGETKDFYKGIKISTMPYGQSMAALCLIEYLKEFY
ncbi:beta-galactosidase BglB [Companilactobacillus baiquanensis]|uniref:Glycoside hydrolase family 105 protein n=1 Tax=Companilactobacillus baiquanensis TaxID=2486005 RepID=A0ABW1UTD5_9LACO|nr:glycoside hydrolase family 88 protein [Companilactobacillus baiquanensis]